MRNGVTIVDPATTTIDVGVEIGQDARIEPDHPGWSDDRPAGRRDRAAHGDPRLPIGPRTRVWVSVVEGSIVAEDVQIGPYAHVRPGCRIGPRCEIMDHAELKNSSLGAGTKQHHFALGDAEVGEEVNIGAGAITANFDGVAKHRTVIGAGAFIGVDTLLRAPVTVGPGARTGAGRW